MALVFYRVVGFTLNAPPIDPNSIAPNQLVLRLVLRLVPPIVS